MRSNEVRILELAKSNRVERTCQICVGFWWIDCIVQFRILRWNLKTCKFYGVPNTKEQSDFPTRLIPVAHRFLENPLVAVSEYYHNHILISKKFYQLSTSFRREVHRANVIQKQICVLFSFASDLFCISSFPRNKNFVQLILIFNIDR